MSRVVEDYREAQRKKWQEQQAAKASAAASSADLPLQASSTPVTEASEHHLSGVAQEIKRLHVLPLAGVDLGGRSVLEILAPELRRCRSLKATVKTGQVMRVDGKDFVVVKSDPNQGHLTMETDYYVEGDPVIKFQKVQFMCFWDFESRHPQDVDRDVLFSEYISPYFKSITDSGGAMNVVCAGEQLEISDHHFQVMATEPAQPEIGIIDSETLVFVDWDSTPEFDKIHILPFQDTLPSVPAYNFDLFNDYLKPYLTTNKYRRFSVNDSFTFQGVQFKVVCCEPSGPARIGRNTTIYYEGILHSSLRTLLPPELLDQISHLPPGLQMLLLNTDALAGDYDMERLMEVQDMLTQRRGLSDQTIQQVEQCRWGEQAGQQESTQCMVCLCEFGQGEDVRKLPCGHFFHVGCIDEWLRRCTECPICRVDVGTAVHQ